MEAAGEGLGSLGELLARVETGLMALVRELLQLYVEKEFLRFIGAGC